ncbi:unnamed protein product [Caenorhabditis bovis]|uniref:Cerebral cavernous malformations 2 harmonin-homology domain-containing protein n=1 Tax=Caenorhabditis bovis TaxID=2654633 RepID=A0A8S1EZU0_9PELO|nr:unnamed protein product [Caenorhabditis bovis]
MEYDVEYLGVIQNENFADLDIHGRTDFLRIFDKAKKNQLIRSASSKLGHKLVLENARIVVVTNDKSDVVFEVPIPLVACCGSLIEDGVVLFVFNITPDMQDQNYRDLMVLAITSESEARKIAENLNKIFSHFAEQQLQNATKQWRTISSSCLTSSPPAPLDTPLTESSHHSSVVSKAINEVRSCLSPEEEPHFRDILQRYTSGENDVKIFAQKLTEMFGAKRKTRLSYLKHVLRAEDVATFDAVLQ